MKSVVIIFSGLCLVLAATDSSENCGENEKMGWISGCDRDKTCDQLLSGVLMGCWPMPAMPACVCNEGFYRSYHGVCVTEEQCKQSCADLNEEYTLGKNCPPDLCVSLVAKYKCDSNEEDQHRCRCKPGYLRLKEDSSCIPICQCPEMKNSASCTQ